VFSISLMDNTISHRRRAKGSALLCMAFHGLHAILSNALRLPLGQIRMISHDHLAIRR